MIMESVDKKLTMTRIANLLNRLITTREIVFVPPFGMLSSYSDNVEIKKVRVLPTKVSYRKTGNTEMFYIDLARCRATHYTFSYRSTKVDVSAKDLKGIYFPFREGAVYTEVPPNTLPLMTVSGNGIIHIGEERDPMMSGKSISEFDSDEFKELNRRLESSIVGYLNCNFSYAEYSKFSFSQIDQVIINERVGKSQ